MFKKFKRLNMLIASISRYCFCRRFRQIVFCFLLCSVSLMFLNWPSSLNGDALSTNGPEWPNQQQQQEEILIQLKRKNLLQEKCQMDKTTDTVGSAQSRKSKKSVIQPVRFKVDNKHQVMYCDIPKVASTNLKGLMLVLSGAVKTDNLSFIPRLTVHEQNPMRIVYANNLNDTIQNGVDKFTKFIFVRHPFERLVSAYKEKFTGNNSFYQKAVARGIIRSYRKNPSALSLQKGHDLTFPEFVHFIVDEWKGERRPLDVHWRPVVDLCLPCVMSFDFIGKFETLNRDVEFLLRKLNESQLIGLFAGQPKAKTTSSLWRQTMKLLSTNQLNELTQMFADDFRIFGYPQYMGEE